MGPGVCCVCVQASLICACVVDLSVPNQCSVPINKEMARITAPELEQFLVATVELTGRVLGAGAYGSVEEVEIPGATVAAKKLHQQLVNLGSPQQVRTYVDRSSSTVIF